MSLYNLSEFFTTVKEEAGIADLPLPVSDDKLLDRFRRKVLVDFSIIYPRLETIYISDDDIIQEQPQIYQPFYLYKIQKWVYDGTSVLDIARFDVSRPNGYSDFFIPHANWATPDAIISAMADVRLAAGMASALAKAPTADFVAPNKIKVYNGWAGGIYEVELLLKHDESLATVPDGSFPVLLELAALDMQAYLYKKLKRKNNVNLGVGESDLKLDDWSNAESEYKELMKEYRSESNLEYGHIRRF